MDLCLAFLVGLRPNDGNLNWIGLFISLDFLHPLRDVCYALVGDEIVKDAFIGMCAFIEDIRSFL
jgi:hypothetical protein